MRVPSSETASWRVTTRPAGDTLARPVAFRRGEDLKDGFQIVEDRQNQPAAAPKILLQGAPLGGLEQFCEISVSVEKCRKGDAENGVGRMGLAADRPGGPPSGSEPAAVPPDPDIRRGSIRVLGPAELPIETTASKNPR